MTALQGTVAQMAENPKDSLSQQSNLSPGQKPQQCVLLCLMVSIQPQDQVVKVAKKCAFWAEVSVLPHEVITLSLISKNKK